MEEQFFEEDLGKLKDKNFNLVVNPERKREILEKVGYSIDDAGYLKDKKTNQKVLAEDGNEINMKTDTNVALITGSHTFVRNIAGYSQLLTEKGILKILPKEN